MVRRQFYINGKPSSDFGIYAASDTYLNAPAVGYDSFSVPKVNGLFISEKDRLSNVTRRFTCFAPDGIKTACEALFQYIYSIDGYFVLQSDYDPGHYCYAYFEEGVEVTPFRTYAGSFDLYFSCMPQKYIGSGQVGGHPGGKGRNLLNADDLIGGDVYYNIVNDKVGITFPAGSSVRTTYAPFNAPAGSYKFKAELLGTMSGTVTLNVSYADNNSTAQYALTVDDTDVSSSIFSTSGHVPYRVYLTANTSAGFTLTKLMLYSIPQTDTSYEDWSTLPPVEKWMYEIETSRGYNVKPTFAYVGSDLLDQLKAHPERFPNKLFWLDWQSINGTLRFTADRVPVFFANRVPDGGLNTAYSIGLFNGGAYNNNLFCVSEFFWGTGYMVSPNDNSSTVTRQITPAIIENTDAVGGDAIYRITVKLETTYERTLSLIINDALVYIDLTDFESANTVITLEINSKTYETTFISPTVDAYDVGANVSLNDRTTIYGDISLKPSNKLACCSLRCDFISCMAEVEWWTV